MIYLVYIAIVIAVLYLSYGVLFYGVRNSLSTLGSDWNQWLFMLFMWTETILLVPSMFTMTGENWQWLVFFIAAGLMFVGGAPITDRYSEKYHIAGAAVACLASIVWIGLINPVLLFIPLFSIMAGGYDRWQWCGEIGLMVSVYLMLV